MGPAVTSRTSRGGAAVGRAILLLAATGWCAVAGAATAKPPVPDQRLPFALLGIPGLSATFLGAGASMLTVNFVGERHLLVTFGSRKLVPRTNDDLEGDQSRLVTAELVELPSGKIVSKTEWRLHDHGRYLWPLGQGRFLLRVHQELSTFAPVENLETKNPWERTNLMHRRGLLEAVELSADSRVLGLVTRPLNAKPPGVVQPSRTVSVMGSGELVDKTAGFVYIDFYRIAGKGSPASPLEAEHAGVVRSPDAIRVPVDGDGYLRSQSGAKGPKGNWKVSFENYEGGTRALAPVGSFCPPVLTLTSRAQLLAFTCRSAMNQDSITMQAYDFAGHEMWEEPIGEVPVTPSFTYAPPAGRFAMSRLLPVGTRQPGDTGDVPSGPAQELRVYQMQSGDLLLKVGVTPTFRTAENYDMAADGSRVVVVHEGELDLYKLPALSKTDREDLEDVAKMEPPVGGKGPINLRKLVEDDAQPAPLKEAEGTVAAVPGAPSLAAEVPAGKAAPSVGIIANGDSQAPRKPPTLLKPGEKAEYKEKKRPE